MSVLCWRCEGSPGRADQGCAACDDTGRVEPPQEPEAPRYAVHVYAVERAQARLERAPQLTRPGRYHAAPTAARRLAEVLSWPDRDPLEAVRDVCGLQGAEAVVVVLVYVAALREHARALRPQRDPRTPRLADEARQAAACLAHAQRIEAALPEWVQEAVTCTR